MGDGSAEYWIDRGGTFTDIVARAPDGTIRTLKLLSHDPARYADAAVAGVRALGGIDAGPPLVKIGTTVATNALLTRTGEPTVFVTTRGFGDALIIGNQARPDIFARAIVKPPPLAATVIEVDERITAEGEVLIALDEAGARAALAKAREAGFASVAIALMHGWLRPDHEARLATIAHELGFAQVSASHEVSATQRLIARAETTVADAYLSPGLRRYVDAVREGLGHEARLFFMQSAGGLVAADRFRGKDAILSGPAGGIVGMARTATALGLTKLIGFDMGGTSTDVSLYAGSYERQFETEIAGVRIAAPMLSIHTVAAGGGSVCSVVGGGLAVGPASAGSDPGPACYRRGGPATVTDCNVLLGKIRPDFFPAVFGENGNQQIDPDASRTVLQALASQIPATNGQCLASEDLAEGLVTIAVDTMARAIRRISTERGHDPAEYTLISFGGAGGQHACLVADALAIARVLIHPLAGVLSALGMGLADVTVTRALTLGWAFAADTAARAAATARTLGDAARSALDDQGVPVGEVTLTATAHVRYAQGDRGFDVPLADASTMRTAFEAEHGRRFGFITPEAAIVLDRLVVEAVGRALGADYAPPELPPQQGPLREAARAQVRMDGRRHSTPIYRREDLGAGATIEGPAIVVDASATTVIEPGWHAHVEPHGELMLARATPIVRARAGAEVDADPVRLALMQSLFMAIAERMGTSLQLSARSVNIRERLDFSCAIFDGAGALVANAPHIPVHLGSMGDSVRAVMVAAPARDGDAWALNNPYRGGTHLPDITVIRPVFLPGGQAPAFFVAARGHHADVGGIAPGSMPARSTTLDEEGVLLNGLLVVDAGSLREAELRTALAAGPWPARNPDQNVADLKAQLAACASGAGELIAAAQTHGAETVAAFMAHVQDKAAEAVARLTATLKDGAFACALDDGAEVRVALRVDRTRRRLTIDFGGTAPQRPGSFNAPLAVTRAAVLYVLRLLVGEDVPLNDGFLRPVDLIVPEGSLLNPRPPAAVVAGNVEVSQIVTDALLGAFGAMAASAGTMSNLTFGDAEHQYYETICGGAGAGPGFEGADAVQTHMTNSRMTDPEILETRFPVMLEEFAVRRGSGGDGQWRGGDGAVRRIRFRRAMTATILSGRRHAAPHGLDGGAAACPGANRVVRADGSVEPLAGTAEVAVATGDVIEIETPGGGGYGPR